MGTNANANWFGTTKGQVLESAPLSRDFIAKQAENTGFIFTHEDDPRGLIGTVRGKISEHMTLDAFKDPEKAKELALKKPTDPDGEGDDSGAMGGPVNAQNLGGQGQSRAERKSVKWANKNMWGNMSVRQQNSTQDFLARQGVAGYSA